MDDIALLRQFAADRSEAAFDQLVSRHAGFVHSAALRQVRDPQWAAEITQAVFLILAQKAARISDKTILTGWLFKTTRFVALAQVRAEAKRRQHEQETQMHTRLQTEPSSGAGDPAWAELAPLLDQALAQLGETDRQAVLLRFFENKSLAEVGNKLGAGEDTARKRVSRALEKLRKFFAKHRVFYSAAIIAGAISANAIQAAPARVVAAIPAMAVQGSAISISTLTLVEEALKLMAIAKLKAAALVAAAAVLAAGGAVVVNRVVAQENQTLRRQTAQSAPLPAATQLNSNVAVPTSAQTSLSEQEVRELARLRDDAGRLRQQINDMARAQSGGNSPVTDESVWLINNSQELGALPPTFILRPTHFANFRGGGGGGGSGGATSAGREMQILFRDISFARLMAMAFGGDVSRVDSPPGAPTGGFDLLMTGPEATKEKLQAEIKRQLGYVAHVESRPTDVLLLSLIQTNAPGLQPSMAETGNIGAGGRSGAGVGSIAISSRHGSVSSVVRMLQPHFHQPILDRTGLTGSYDISFNVAWEAGRPQSNAISQALTTQLGLALAPGSEPMDHLIVEADKETAQLSPLQTGNQQPSDVKVPTSPTSPLSEQPVLELARLRAEVGRLRQQSNDLAQARFSGNPPTTDESVWLIENPKDLESLPPAFILRPTQFAHGAGILRQGSQILARKISFAALMATAFEMDTNKVISPLGAPTGGFDLLLTGPEATKEKLQAEIKRQLGCVARVETRPTDVLLLTLIQTNAPGLQPSHAAPGAPGGGGFVGGSPAIMSNWPIAALIQRMKPQFQQTILDRSGLTGRYDILLPVALLSGRLQSDGIIRALTPLGLALIPSREPLDFLVVEADKGN
ncbi:MAG: TIGR03435 family protein [Verrucomicrobiota bacterium]